MAEEQGVRVVTAEERNTVDAGGTADTAKRLGSGTAGSVLLAVSSGLTDALILASFASGSLSVAATALAHMALTVASGIVAGRIADDRTFQVLLVSGLVVTGPFGAAGALVLLLADRPSSRTNGRLDDWYLQLSGIQRASEAQSLHESIAEDRAYRPYGPPVPFPAVLAKGSVGDRQTVLGLLVKERRPVPEALLATALRSRDVAVRASAAAAVSRIRENAARASGSPEHSA